MSGLLPPTGTKGSPFSPGWCYQPGEKGWAFYPEWSHQPGQKGVILSRLVPPTGTKDICPPAGPASRWTRDKSHLLSRAQRQPEQMAWNKGMSSSIGAYYVTFCARPPEALLAAISYHICFFLVNVSCLIPSPDVICLLFPHPSYFSSIHCTLLSQIHLS